MERGSFCRYNQHSSFAFQMNCCLRLDDTTSLRKYLCLSSKDTPSLEANYCLFACAGFHFHILYRLNLSMGCCYFDILLASFATILKMNQSLLGRWDTTGTASHACVTSLFVLQLSYVGFYRTACWPGWHGTFWTLSLRKNLGRHKLTFIKIECCSTMFSQQ